LLTHASCETDTASAWLIAGKAMLAINNLSPPRCHRFSVRLFSRLNQYVYRQHRLPGYQPRGSTALAEPGAERHDDRQAKNIGIADPRQLRDGYRRVATVFLFGFFLDLINMFIASIAFPAISHALAVSGVKTAVLVHSAG
jgi:hypothetical protein